MNWKTHIGLSNQPGACTSEPPSDLNVSESGIYVSDLPDSPLSMLDGNGIWNRLSAFRDSAGKQLESDLLALLSPIYVPRASWSGVLGGTTQNQFVLAGETSLTIQTKAIEGASLRIRSLGLKLSTAIGVTVDLFEPGNTTPLQSVAITSTTAEAAQMLSPNFVIPLDGRAYTLKATLPGGVRYADTNLSCGCGGNANRVAQFIDNGLLTKAGGFLLHIDTKCSYAGFIEKLTEDDRIWSVIAFMHAYLTGFFALRSEVSGSESGVNRDTLLPGNDKRERAGQYLSAYSERLSYLKANLPRDLPTTGACYHCPPASVRGAFR